MDGKPDRLLFRIRPLHAVADMTGNEEMIAGLEIDLPAIIAQRYLLFFVGSFSQRLKPCRGLSRDEQIEEAGPNSHFVPRHP